VFQVMKIITYWHRSTHWKFCLIIIGGKRSNGLASERSFFDSSSAI